MVLFRIRKDDGTEIPIYVVENFGFGASQGVIIYEAPGSDGGTILTTGRKNRNVTLSGRIIGTGLTDLNEKKVALENARDSGEAINLDTPLDSEDTGRYIIETFEGSLPVGQERYITFSLVLQEYRQANIQQTAINLVNFQPAQLLTERARARNILA